VKKLVSLILIFSVLSCNFSALAAEDGGEFESKSGKQSELKKEDGSHKKIKYLDARLAGGVAQLAVVATSLVSLVFLVKSKLPLRVKLCLGYYGGLASLLAINGLELLDKPNDYLIKPIMDGLISWGIIGIVPTVLCLRGYLF